eukprot:Opistho-1_new@41378
MLWLYSSSLPLRNMCPPAHVPSHMCRHTPVWTRSMCSARARVLMALRTSDGARSLEPGLPASDATNTASYFSHMVHTPGLLPDPPRDWSRMCVAVMCASIASAASLSECGVAGHADLQKSHVPTDADGPRPICSRTFCSARLTSGRFADALCGFSEHAQWTTKQPPPQSSQRALVSSHVDPTASPFSGSKFSEPNAHASGLRRTCTRRGLCCCCCCCCCCAGWPPPPSGCCFLRLAAIAVAARPFCCGWDLHTPVPPCRGTRGTAAAATSALFARQCTGAVGCPEPTRPRCNGDPNFAAGGDLRRRVVDAHSRCETASPGTPT